MATNNGASNNSQDDVTSRLLDFTQDPQAYVQYLDSVVATFFSPQDKAQARFALFRSAHRTCCSWHETWIWRFHASPAFLLQAMVIAERPQLMVICSTMFSLCKSGTYIHHTRH